MAVDDSHFSVTTGMNPSTKRAIHPLPDQAWQQITYPTAVPDPATGELISDEALNEHPLLIQEAGVATTE
ncbi:hypothetical protein [Streptomyces atratus]|uniref:hypothetical protein n=1 Tax=Streptomyces atratus TaxID=1893 RepID=UPI00224ECEC4|nr:hypothetical protein [Streptomyces atratus]MCX5339681.1 hypothetical protein [Streptomyces atratus]